MPQDKYSAVWVSHSSLGDFLKCPRSYYLKNVYKNPKTGKKINIVSPALSLGSAVHQVVEGLGAFKVEERFTQNLEEEFQKAWEKFSGKKGGFLSAEDEKEAKERGLAMIRRVIANPGPLKNKTVKLPEREMLPNFFLSESDNIILCGKIDWIEYIPEDDSIRVLDFKTGKNEEKEDSLQLPIYLLLLKNLQKRKVTGASYWYLDKDDTPIAVKLPDYEKARADVLEKAKKVKEAREKKEFLCPKGEKGCFACRPFEKILKGEAEYLGVGEYNQELYLLK
ncbi:MAG: PD-(D/E)XK nuclease family protein [Candidatus Pacebacteria bacterium]|nr:PD-(D/E)XK nuclease family protein [Candidatus Paceibacterota bacterium]MDD5356655.1 PD-(D/E)XK nuclease family protein [Candidatus Paceibacterota bacterium]